MNETLVIIEEISGAAVYAFDCCNRYRMLEGSDEEPMDQLRGHSITYRIAVGPQQGRKVFTLQTLPDERDAYESPTAGNVAGFSLHAAVAAKANQRDKLERVCGEFLLCRMNRCKIQVLSCGY